MPLGRVLPLYLVVFVGFLGYSLMITVFTPLLLDGDELLGADASTSTRAIVLGVLLALYPLAQFAGAPVMGALSDRFGRRRVLLWSLAASAGCYALIATALHEQSLALLMAACALAGLSEANVAIAQSAVADVAPPAQRTRLFGYVYVASSLAYVAGPLAGGKLADPSLVSWFGAATPYWAVAGLLLATLGLTAVRFRETHAPRPPTDARPSTRATALRALWNVGAAFAPGRLRPIFLANFVLYLAIFGFFRVYPMYLVDHFDMGVSKESELIAWVAVPIVIANLGLVAWLSRRWSPWQVATRFGIVLAVFLALVVVPEPQAWLWVTLAGCALALALCLPAMASMVSAAAPPDEQGAALGANQSLQVGAEALSGLAGGLLAALSTTLPLPVMGLMALAGVALLARPAARASVGRPG